MTSPTIHLEGDFLCLGLHEGRTHEVRLPLANPKWAQALLNVLRARQSHGPTRLATKPAPIQHQVDQWLKANKPKQPKSKVSVAGVEHFDVAEAIRKVGIR